MVNDINNEGQDGNVYGNLVGPNAVYIKLIADDGHEFIIKKEYAMMCGTIQAMLSGPGEFNVNEINEIRLRNIPSHILQIICMLLYFKARYQNTTGSIPEFLIPHTFALDVLMAANFLDI